MEDPTHILIWIFIFGLTVVLGSLLCLVARQWRRIGETRRRERGLLGGSVGRAHISVRTLANRDRVLELWDSSRLEAATTRGGETYGDPCWQVTDLESSPPSSLADSLAEHHLPSTTLSPTADASVRPGPFRLLTSPLSSSGPVLGVVRILGSPTTLFVASAGRGVRRHITMPVRPTSSPPGWSDRLGEIDVWCPAMPFGQLLSHSTPTSHTAVRCLSNNGGAFYGRDDPSTAIAVGRSTSSTTGGDTTTVSADEEPAYLGRSAARALADAAEIADEAVPSGTRGRAAGGEEDAVTTATSSSHLAAIGGGGGGGGGDGQLVAADGRRISLHAAASSSSSSAVPWATTVLKLNPPGDGDDQQQQQQSTTSGGEANADEASDSGCAICIEDFVYSSIVRALPCGHVFHRLCLDSWFERSSVCPLCLHDYQQSWRGSESSGSDSFFPPATSLVLLSFRPLAPRGGAAPAAAAVSGRGPSHSMLLPSQSSRISTTTGTHNSVSSTARSTASSMSYSAAGAPSSVTYYRRAESYQNSRLHRGARNGVRGCGTVSSRMTPRQQRLQDVSPTAAGAVSMLSPSTAISASSTAASSRRSTTIRARAAQGPADAPRGGGRARNARSTLSDIIPNAGAREIRMVNDGSGSSNSSSIRGEAVASDSEVAADATENFSLTITPAGPSSAAATSHDHTAGGDREATGAWSAGSTGPVPRRGALTEQALASTGPTTNSQASAATLAAGAPSHMTRGEGLVSSQTGSSVAAVTPVRGAGEAAAPAAVAAAAAAATSEVLLRESVAHAQDTRSG